MSDLLIEFLGGSQTGQQISIAAEDLSGLESFLQGLRLDDPLFINITLSQGDELTVGIGPTRSCVQHSAKEHEPPYFIAQEPNVLVEDLELEFDAGGTPTPIMISQTLPSDKAIALILEIVSTEVLPAYVEWVEV